MPTLGTQPSLEATQAVGAVLLHQFARERFAEAGIDESLISEAEDRAHLNVLAETVLHEEAPNMNNTSGQDNDDSNGHNSSTANNTSGQDNDDSNGHNGSTANINDSSRQQQGEENFHSIINESAGPNGTINRSVQDRTVYHSINASNQSPPPDSFERLQASPCLASYGKELRRIADEFERSRLRQTVKERARQVDLADITKDSFVKLLEELFQEKITREKIVILFFFCTDVALRAAKTAQDLVKKLLGWSFSYIIERVCRFIHELGGWDKVLFYQLPSILITCCAALAICSLVVYLKKNLLRAA